MIKHIVTLNGTSIELLKSDIDKNGNIGGIEKITPDISQEIARPKESTELGDTFEIAFRDIINKDTGTSSMDFLANIKTEEENIIFVINSLVTARFLPKAYLQVVRQYLRLSVSRNSRGRDDIKEIAIGKRTEQKKSLRNFFGLGKKEETKKED